MKVQRANVCKKYFKIGVTQNTLLKKISLESCRVRMGWGNLGSCLHSRKGVIPHKVLAHSSHYSYQPNLSLHLLLEAQVHFLNFLFFIFAINITSISFLGLTNWGKGGNKGSNIWDYFPYPWSPRLETTFLITLTQILSDSFQTCRL